MGRASASQRLGFIVSLLAVAVLAAGCTIVPGPVALDAIRAALERQGASAGPTVGPPAAEPTQSSGETATGGPKVTFDPPPKRKGPFDLDLYRSNAHVPQYTASWCVGASMQMMINLMKRGRVDRTLTTQQRLYRLARRISPWVETRPGAGLYGWSVGLEQLGYGTFEEIGANSRQEALKLAAIQMRITNKPVGLWVWRGKHAWVISGFKATADPAVTNDFRVTAVWIEDPWSGRVSTIWGPGLAPHTLVRADELGSDFLRWSSEHRPEYGARGRFVILAPVA